MSLTDVPDVVSAITPHKAIINGHLHTAVGAFPPQSALGQPFQVIILLQNATDRPIDTFIQLGVARKDKAGNRLSFFIPKIKTQLLLEPVEVSVLYLPVIAQPPTPVGQTYPILINIETSTAPDAKVLRPPTNGRPPTILSVSPFKLDVLREVKFSTRERKPKQLICNIELIPGAVPVAQSTAQPKVESLWTVHELREEKQAAESIKPEARAYANTLSPANTLDPLTEMVEKKFANANMPLHPGESLMIAKLLGYVLDNGMSLEEGFSLEKSFWFRRLCNLMVKDRDITDSMYTVIEQAFDAIILDATLLGLAILNRNLGLDVGDTTERNAYADEIRQAIGGKIEMNLSYVYLPLVMGGITLNHFVKLMGDSLSYNLDQMQEALDGRKSLTGTADLSGGYNEIFQLTQKLITRARSVSQ